jgi:hypothetical protein
MSTFQERLWSDLVREHGDQIRAHPATPIAVRRRRRPALVTGTALAVTGAAIAAALILSATTSAPPAYAVTTNSDGTVTVTLNDISAITALNAELARDGVRAKAIPLTATCPTRGFPHPIPAGTDPSTYTITIVPADIPAGYTAVVAARQTASGQVQLVQGAWPNPGPTCINSRPIPIPRSL